MSATMWRHAGAYLSDADLLTIGEGRLPRHLAECMRALAEDFAKVGDTMTNARVSVFMHNGKLMFDVDATGVAGHENWRPSEPDRDIPPHVATALAQVRLLIADRTTWGPDDRLDVIAS